MRSDNRFLSITLLMLMFTMGILNLFGQKRGFATVVKQAVERVQKEADKDPDTFKDNMQRLEKELGGRKSPVERSVADAMLASAYQEMKWTNITDFDEETRDAYDAKCNEHFSHVLDNMEALAAEKATGWEVLLDKGKDSDLYGNDLLSVMIAFVEENARLKVEERASIYERAIKVYQQRGNLNGYGLMKAKWLDVMQEVENVEGRLSYKQYKESLYQLILEVKTEEVGADLALKYSEHNLGRDDAILFRKWAVENLGKSRSMNNLKNALAAITIGCFFHVPAPAICEALEEYVPHNNRSQLTETEHNHLVVDAYNANPTSMHAALENFRIMNVPHKMVILGDMRELGASSVEAHQKVLEYLSTCDFDRVILVGEEFGKVNTGYEHYPDVEALKVVLAQHLPENMYILIKGSNSMKLAQLQEIL